MMKSLLRNFLAILVFIGVFFIFFNVKSAAMESNLAVNGVYTILNFPEDELIKLDGEWEFYWEELLTPSDSYLPSSPQNPYLLEIPHSTNGFQIDNATQKSSGYGTYRLQIVFPKNQVGTTKALYMPSVATAYTIWINGEEKATNGVVGTSRELMKPENVPKIISFKINSQTVEFVIQVSNFHQRKGGITKSLFIGELQPILQYQNERLIYRTVIVISLVLIGLYHATLFAFRRQEPSLIFFGAACFAVAFRATLLEEGLAAYVLSFLDWELASKLEYLGATLGVLFFSLFTYTQFSDDMNERIRNIIIGMMSLYSWFIILTPAIVYTKTMALLQALIMLTFVYLLFVYTTALRRKREGAIINAVAIFVLFVAALNDTFYFNNLVDTTEMASMGLLFFLFTQSIIISKRYSRAYAKNEKLSQDLTVLNASLEKQVQQRTTELNESNKQLQVVNQKLHEADQSRRRLISNIIHEIGNPLTSMLAYTRGLLDGVIDLEKKYIKLVHEKTVYLSEMLNDLRAMTNSEYTQTIYDFKMINICEYSQELYEKYKPDLEKQSILFLYKDLLSRREEENFVLIDPVRIEQVIVNLLSNAQRFVAEYGTITLELEKKDEEHIVIKVTDNGIGIKEEELDFVFDRYYRGQTRQEAHKGSGLGLAISKEIIEHHEGTIGVTSKEGIGTSFYFTLPIIKEQV